jgi:hypothetical protein
MKKKLRAVVKLGKIYQITAVKQVITATNKSAL